MPSSSISFRRSIRWLPDEASEPTNTVVLTGGKTGVFLDIRFDKNTGVLDWAFAGFRIDTSPNSVKFEHHIDSRTSRALDVVDQGVNSTLEDGTTLEVGEMVNPQTGKMTPYEEIWEDDNRMQSDATKLFTRNVSGTAWKARLGDWQLGMGRTGKDEFWAWQARKLADGWKIEHSTPGLNGQPGTNLLPDLFLDVAAHDDEHVFNDDGDSWVVVEC